MSSQEARLSTVLDVIIHAAQTQTRDEFDRLILGPVKALLRFEVMTCGIGITIEDGSYGHKFRNYGFPMDYLFELEQPDGSLDSPLMQQWRKTMKPVFFQGGRDDANFPADWIETFNRYDLRNILSSAMSEPHGKVSNYFIFARMDEEVGQMQANLLELITPNLSAAVVRALGAAEFEPIRFAGDFNKVLSPKQREILHWMYHGKTNPEIGSILGMNDETVKYHVEQVMRKLKVSSRAQAAAKAVEFGLISPGKRA